MIQIIPIGDLKNVILDDYKDSNNIFITNLDLISKLMTIELPIKNRNIAIKNILSFLKFIDVQVTICKSNSIKLHSDKLIYYLSRDYYKKYMDILNDEFIITKIPNENPSIDKGVTYTYYKKSTPLTKGYSTTYLIHDDYLRRKDLAIVIINEERNIKVNTDFDYNKKLVNTMKKIDINLKECIEEEINNIKDIKNLKLRISRVLSLFNNERNIKKGINVNRVYHSLSNLDKIARKYLHIDGKRFNNVDIANCQPLLLCYYLKSKGLDIDNNYISDCEFGILYSRFMDKFNLNRDITKKRLYKSIYFKWNIKMKFNKYFKEIYPLTWNSINNLSINGSIIARELQNIEADIFNNIIPEKSKYYFPLFDGLYFTNDEDMGYIYKEILNRFSIYNLKPKIKFNDDEISEEEFDLIEDLEEENEYSKIISEDEFFKS